MRCAWCMNGARATRNDLSAWSSRHGHCWCDFSLLLVVCGQLLAAVGIAGGVLTRSVENLTRCAPIRADSSSLRHWVCKRRMKVMNLACRVLWISLSGFLWSVACANELPDMADDDKAAMGSVAPPVVGAGMAGSLSASADSKPNSPPATTPASSGSTSEPSRPSAPPAATSGRAGADAGAAGAGGSASPATPAADSGDAGASGSVAAPTTPVAGSPAPAAPSGAAGTEAFPDLGDILPPLSTPETRVPSPNNPAECPATAPENPIGDCLGLPVYLECTYGTYYCVCDWFHWLCAG